MEYEDLYRLILNDELGWEHVISSIIREEGMDPLDIDIARLAEKFSSLILRLNGIDFRIGGKFVYTAAILLKIKSDKMVDDILERKKEQDDGDEGSRYVKAIATEISITPKLPLIRNRKLTLTELIGAIREAIRYSTKPKVNFELKIKEIKMEERIIMLMEKLIKVFGGKDIIAMSELMVRIDRKEIVYTFLPLLFLSNMGKVELQQEAPFTEIYVKSKRTD